jgi:hypothetical protein
MRNNHFEGGKPFIAPLSAAAFSAFNAAEPATGPVSLITRLKAKAATIARRGLTAAMPPGAGGAGWLSPS